MVEAQNIRDGLRDELTQLNYSKTMRTDRRENGIDPTLMSHANQFVKNHPWWDASGGDEDSRRVSRIDAALAREGLDPLTPEYGRSWLIE